MGKYQGYEKYKDSGVEWLGEIPEHWEVKRTKFFVTKIGSGKTPKGGSEIYVDSGVMLIRSQNVYDDGLRLDDVVYIDDEIDNLQINSRVFPNDILLNITGASIGRVSLVPPNFIKANVNQHVCIFRPDLKKIFPPYLHLLLCSKQGKEQIFSYENGTSREGLNFQQAGNLTFAIPPPDEQEIIARFLDHKTKQIDDLIAKKEALLEKLDEKRTALISHAVTKGLDPSVPMKDSGIEWLGKIPKHWSLLLLRLRYLIELGKMLDQRRISGDYLVQYLRNVDVQWDFINQNDLPEMDINPNEYERYLVKNGDLLVCEGGESGRSAIVQGVDGILGFQKAIHRLRVIGTEEIPRFLFYIFYYLVKLGVFVAEGNPNTITHLTVEKLKLYRLPKPPKKEQQAIVTYLDHKTAEIKQQKAKILEAIELLKEYRTALITNAVTGKIDVRQVPIP
ncbi:MULTISPECIES: restriction endonuclease subunit S [unclassified Tolypothrix]|nr:MULTISPECIES: restriction endonuclease subunit S [unclassified Tolypothrix]BAY94825.1 restriction modification system DNA specificity domain protein [Microchaete diplosiphon NIES-3275]EKE99278.1 type I restriction modification DNA specificity domain protein [Tolypothrix sp. PCC 7601]MBE9086135.1 restriction endonuclease subunit S [Tolypothrix sp. LEGE 11397]UYD28481.1 restriction endonuclease subunit S [Tolypothrix sp. PCC 7712]UYD35608.1 restriction endonuclease subunit S [Tolypothrix sp. 